MRVVLITIAVYAGLLLVFLGVRHHQLTETIHARVEDVTMKAIATRPVDHRHTLFSGVLVEQVTQILPYVAGGDADASEPYELVAMTPCNPRIHRCS